MRTALCRSSTTVWQAGALRQQLGHDPTHCVDAGIRQNRGIARRGALGLGAGHLPASLFAEAGVQGALINAGISRCTISCAAAMCMAAVVR